MKRQTLGDVSQGRSNVFDFLRFFLASMVIVSHSYAMLYNGTWNGFDPLLHLTHGQAGMGGTAVYGFFLISGFLITKSWEHSDGGTDYAKRRALRIIPALVVVVLVSVFVIGPLSTDLSLASYFTSLKTYQYFTMMGTVHLHLTDRLPGVFEHNPERWRVNGSLWTIRVEAFCYVLVAALGLIGAYRRPAIVLIASLIGVAAFSSGGSNPIGVGEFAASLQVATYFLWGMTFYLYRNIIPHNMVLFVASLVLIAVSDILGVLPHTAPMLGAYALFYIAFRPVLGLQHFARSGDLSYGLYLYAFPIAQALVSHFPLMWSVGTLILATFVVSLSCAALSWYFVEKPCLHLKRRALKSTELAVKSSKPIVAFGSEQVEPVGEKS